MYHRPQQSKIIAVGHTITLSSEQVQMITEIGAQHGSSIPISDEAKTVYVGVWYGGASKGSPRDSKKDDAFLNSWYARIKDRSYTAFLRQLYIHEKFIVGVIDCDVLSKEKLYVMLFNGRSGTSTTGLKSQINHGDFGSPIQIERQSFIARAYMSKV